MQEREVLVVLAGIGANAFGSTSNITLSSSTSVLSLRGDSNTSFVRASDSVNYTVSMGATTATINVDQATTGGTTAKTMSIGTLALFAATTNQTNFTGANNTSLSVGAVTGGTSTGGTETIQNSISGGGSLSLASFSTTRTGTQVLAFTGNGDTSVGAITQNGSNVMALTKSGSGTLILSGSNNYAGSTTVSAGTLKTASAGGNVGTGNVVVTTSSTVLELDNPNSINDASTLNLAAGTTLYLNFSTASGTESVRTATFGGVLFNTPTVFSFGNLHGVSSSFFQFQSGTNQGSLTVVPEPASLGLASLGATTLLMRRRRRAI